MPRDINTLLRKDALMKVDKRSEKYVQPSRRRRRGDGDDAGLAHERRGGGGAGGGGGRACPSYRTALLPSRRRGEEEGEGRGVWRNSPDAICINEPPDNGARSMNYVPRDSNPNETRIIAFDSSLAPPSPRAAHPAATVRRRWRRHCASFRAGKGRVLENRRSPRFLSGFLFASGLSDGLVERSVWDF